MGTDRFERVFSDRGKISVVFAGSSAWATLEDERRVEESSLKGLTEQIADYVFQHIDGGLHVLLIDLELFSNLHTISPQRISKTKIQ